MENTGDPNRMWVEELIDHPPMAEFSFARNRFNFLWILGIMPGLIYALATKKEITVYIPAPSSLIPQIQNKYSNI
jgi:hypothetical protein